MNCLFRVNPEKCFAISARCSQSALAAMAARWRILRSTTTAQATTSTGTKNHGYARITPTTV
ncbi:hypothetical protein A5700_22520 [Mycobacterium sp. E1214]|nr:hypothetical protein A5700_22520 [Mycobacterium sp. E1214]